MDSLDPKWAGYCFDLEDATEEGGAEGWRINAHLVMPCKTMMAVKDFYCRETSTTGWQETTCPLGDGICRWSEFLKIPAAAGFHGTISLHVEYQIPGVSVDQGIALSRENDAAITAAARRDLDTLKPLSREPYEGSR
jgi:sugar phosphate isomerase/epimerase